MNVLKLFVAALAAASTIAHAEPSTATAVIAVALKPLDGTVRERAVILAIPDPQSGGHVGVILNRPTGAKLSAFLPGYVPADFVTDPLYLGGDSLPNALIAIAKSKKDPGGGALPILPGLWLVADSGAVEDILIWAPNDARYYAGYISMRAGELEDDARLGRVKLLPADEAVIFRPDAAALYEELAPLNREVGLEL